MGFIELIRLERCRPDGGTFVEHGGRELAVFRVGEPEQVIVLDNVCPHAGGNLSGGLTQGGPSGGESPSCEAPAPRYVVTCPWHHWEFDLETGECTHSPLARVRRYRAEIREGVIWVEL